MLKWKTIAAGNLFRGKHFFTYQAAVDEEVVAVDDGHDGLTTLTTFLRLK